ncbi:hypothetical protein CDIK_2488 [Cucumispora dikerogammari]|nr:hypothetical protein CDIK_2488 [Cucumispora dikerogammari]
MSRLAIKGCLNLFLINTIRISYIKSIEETGEYYHFRSLIKNCLSGEINYMDGSAVDLFWNVGKKTYTTLPFTLPDSIITKPEKTRAPFILVPVIPVLTNKGFKIDPEYAKKNFSYKIYYETRKNKKLDYPTKFHYRFEPKVVDSFKYCDTEIGFDKSHAVNPGYFFFIITILEV